ncbi:Haloacid dehalogenase-like hydrolase superfamily protein [Rhynchospora pubera]|uniref:Haloacid dehalogenase-like hydrolase superfamily protein n=1 Tax=Rhynchospora pubera TaxID=906938 RepID=A0AAV8E5Q6_9POAL|nr:Haloacid dehalogenase-like hydrolase superfamily protein [Rhynchospora pubera]
MGLDSITASTSTVARQLFVKIPHSKDLTYKQRSVPCHLSSSGFMGLRLICHPAPQVVLIHQSKNPMKLTIKSVALVARKEEKPHSKNSRIVPHAYTVDAGMRPTKQWPPPNRADDPKIHNPLVRLERMGCGWLAVILEWEGVIVEDDPKIVKQAWLLLAEEEGKSPPPAFVLKRIEGMKNEQAISEVLFWSRDQSEVRRMAARKEEILKNLQNGALYKVRNGSREFMNTLVKHNIPIAVTSTRPRKVLEEAIELTGVQSFLNVVMTAEDVHHGKPDPEMFVYASELLKYIPERCIVFGNSNSTVEAAHDARMKCVVVASTHPVYELSAADLVVNRLDELSIIDLKNLGAVDSPEFDLPEVEMELEEEEEEDELPHPAVGVDDLF